MKKKSKVSEVKPVKLTEEKIKQALQIVPVPEAKKEIVKPSMPELTLEDIKKYINPNVTDNEAFMFLQLCRSQGLNPFVKEVYLIKYSKSEFEPATMVVGKDVFTKRAAHCPNFNGFKAGVILVSSGQIIYREGSFYTEKEILSGGWAEVFIKGHLVPIRNEVRLKEYEGHKKDGTVTKNWKEKPGTMIRKVALVQSLRESFPDQFQGLYDSAEMGIELTEIKNAEYIPAPETKQEKRQLAPPPIPQETPKEKAPIKFTLPKNLLPDSLCDLGKYKAKPIAYKDIPLDFLKILWEKAENPSELDGVLSWVIRANMEVKLAGKKYDWDKFMELDVKEKLNEYVKIAGGK